MTNDFFEKHLSELNEQQLKAVQSVYGAVLLLAVPGSGKTTVLIKRLGYMIYCKNIKPSEILVVTYTVSATEDMKKRYIKYFGEEYSSDIEFRTINGICAKLLYQFEKRSNRELFDLADDKKINSILINIYMKYNNDFPSEQDITAVRTAITYIKNMMLTDNEIKKLKVKDVDHISEIYYDYVSVMKQNGLMDYDDQMKYSLQILKSYPEVLSYYQDKYKYICVDEAQDTSKIQHEIIRLLASKNRNIFMVGDEDQCIYLFRAAYPEALLEFEKVYKNATVLLMETNYRSNANIVITADDFIQKNKLRHKKTMIASKPPQTKPEFIQVFTRQEQYEKLFKVLSNCHRETAVLYRNNDSCIPIVDYLDRNNIDFNIKNADLTFFSHKTIKDIEDFLKFAENPQNTEVFMRIYYKLGLYLNKKTAIEICNESKKTNAAVLLTLSRKENIDEFIKKRTYELMSYFKMLTTATSRKAINIIMDMIDYGSYLNNNHISDSKIDILRILSANENTLENLLNRLRKLEDIISNKDFNKNTQITLTTIHSSKGLEYDNVYLVDIIDGMFPEKVPQLNKMNDSERKTWEEERRLFYVGMTRAKYNLYIFDHYKVSAFVAELRSDEKKRTKLNNQKKMKKEIKENHLKISLKDFTDFLNVGARINHKNFGNGTVIGVDKDNISVMFDGNIVKHTFNIKAVYSLDVINFI